MKSSDMLKDIYKVYDKSHNLIYHPDTAEKGDNNVRLYVN